MDVAGLRDCIRLTLDPNSDIRRRAELDLKVAEDLPGFLDALLNILEAEQDAPIRLSTVVYLKNRVNRGWSPSPDPPIHKAIAVDEKLRFRERIIPLVAASPPQIRQQLLPMLQKILNIDFPGSWPSFLDITLQLLNTNDANSIYTGLQCILGICKVFRFKAADDRSDFEKIVALSFPRLLIIGNDLVNGSSNEVGEMLRTVMKAFKHAIYYDLPPHLREQNIIVNWCMLLLKVVAKDVPPEAMSEDLEDRETNHWWKSKKWACSNLNRLFVRYGNPTSISKTDTGNYNEFSKIFIAEFAPEILRVYLQQVEKWVAKTAWLSRPCLSFTMAFLEECIKPKSTWNHLKPHIDTLVKHLLFPVLCQSDEDIELFESDPSEYIHKKLNFYEEVSAPDIAATNFLVTLTKSRKKQTFVILSFVNNIVIKYEQAPGDQRNPREMEGALRMIGTLASVILAKKSPIADQVEIFFVRHVFPEFRSPYGYLRARACDTLEKFSELNFTHQENLMNVYRLILELMGDPELPVRVEAALSLQPLIRHDPVRNAMQQSIPQIMQQLLKITNQVDLDALANVMEDFVEVFATELTPFAVALTEQLRDTYLRIVRELLERQAGKDDEDSGYGDYLDDKSITALGVLQTIGTLILTLESTPDVLLHLETILMPIITITLDNKLFDLYNEVFEIIDSCTFAAKSISPTMWQAFELIHKTFKSGAELYLEDMLPALDNFVAFGTEVLIQNRAYLEAVIDMVHDIFRDVKVGGVDRICGCKLAEAIMIHLRGHADQYIPKFVDLGMNCLTNEEPKVKSYRIHLMEMVINAIYYNPKLALHILESGGWTNKFFSAWFSSIDSFTRVHDKKLCIAAISALLTLRANEVPISVQQGWPRLLQGIVRLFQTLPLALKNREEVTKDEFALEGEFNEEEDENEWNGNETPWAAENEDAEEDVKDESNTYLEFLNNESKKFGAAISSEAEDDELEEESMLDTPLDKLEPYSMFRDALLTLQQSQPQLYENLTNNLTSEETLVVQNVVNQAHVLDQARAAEIAAAQAQLASSRQLISPT